MMAILALLILLFDDNERQIKQKVRLMFLLHDITSTEGIAYSMHCVNNSETWRIHINRSNQIFKIKFQTAI